MYVWMCVYYRRKRFSEIFESGIRRWIRAIRSRKQDEKMLYVVNHNNYNSLNEGGMEGWKEKEQLEHIYIENKKRKRKD
jgi:hypothetical protein